VCVLLVVVSYERDIDVCRRVGVRCDWSGDPITKRISLVDSRVDRVLLRIRKRIAQYLRAPVDHAHGQAAADAISRVDYIQACG
jgi:hypothetical protein